ncbi:MAG: cbb3-type cytochrome c oxidase subunit I [Bacteroidetes bacterium]|nr:cbb3-type cytochrome c oxidase subunit I [Bacteroidota bacterium]
MLQISPVEIKRQRKLVIIWSITFMVVFPLLIILGLLMRLNQGEDINLGADTFYTLMTLHGLGMAGLLFTFSFAGLWYLVGTRQAKLNISVGYFVYTLVLIGVIGLAIATLIGKFGPGWYMLYPLPFIGVNWPAWSTGLAIVSLIIMGVAWLSGIIHLVSAMSKEFGGFSNLMGWQYLRKRKEGERDLPPIVMITTISLVPGLCAFLIGAAMLFMYLMQLLEPALHFNPLLMKNMVMFFGHTLVNITLYCCVGWVYALLPEYTGREWKTDKVLVYSWNATFIFILFAYFHHLYMDFAQPSAFQYIGQIVSYSSAIPATAITMFGVISQIYHSKIKWGVIPVCFLIGVAGWAIGGFSAVVDSTIAVNSVLHNTLWVPAHFHTYMLGGVVLFILGLIFYLSHTKEEQEKDKTAKFGFWLFVISIHCFIGMFYSGGLNSIPRRYADYKGIPIVSVHHTGALLAEIAALFIILLLIGLFIMYFAIIIKLSKQKNASLIKSV